MPLSSAPYSMGVQLSIGPFWASWEARGATSRLHPGALGSSRWFSCSPPGSHLCGWEWEPGRALDLTLDRQTPS